MRVSATHHPAATGHLPWFITAPGQVDVLNGITALILLASIFMVGVFFFYMHSLPERLGHKKLQFEIVAVLGLLSLFTHIHLFWVVGLILALIDFPDFSTPLQRIAHSLESMSGSALPAEPAKRADEAKIERRI